MKPAAQYLKQKGFSIVEVIMAVFLTGTIVLVIANIPQVIRLVTGSRYESKVRQVAAKKIEDVRLAGYDNLVNGTTAISDPLLSNLADVAGSVIIADCPAETCPNGELVKQVTVIISWDEEGSPKDFRVMTLVAKGGLK